MTALSNYERLESPGRWRAETGAEAIEVIVSLGEASLVISSGGERALAHWSLAAIERRGATLYAPGPDAVEELELDDPTMVTAIERVQAALQRRRPGGNRLRRLCGWSVGLAMTLAALFWLPQALTRHAARIAPEATRADLDSALLAHLPAACATPEGTAALDRLAGRLLQGDGPPLVVARGEIPAPVALPGGTLVLPRAVVEDTQDPGVTAGAVLAAEARRTSRDPLLALLADAGPLAALRLLTTGTLPAEALEARAETLLRTSPAPAPRAALSRAFARARVDPAPYVAAEGLSPLAADGDSVEILPDGDWVALQGICGG